MIQIIPSRSNYDESKRGEVLVDKQPLKTTQKTLYSPLGTLKYQNCQLIIIFLPLSAIWRSWRNTRCVFTRCKIIFTRFHTTKCIYTTIGTFRGKHAGKNNTNMTKTYRRWRYLVIIMEYNAVYHLVTKCTRENEGKSEWQTETMTIFHS